MYFAYYHNCILTVAAFWQYAVCLFQMFDSAIFPNKYEWLSIGSGSNVPHCMLISMEHADSQIIAYSTGYVFWGLLILDSYENW